ncbi:DUF4148 domain-containing protein [Paraburkholderia fungorum]|nr:DUF4148 domain-containing protein [Paraburkholderia fungorum]
MRILALAIAAAIVVPVGCYAEQSAPVTREQVRAELIQLEQAGYNPAVADPYYPSKLQAAEASISEQNGTAESSYGGIPSTVSDSSTAPETPTANTRESVYVGH